MRSSQPYPSSAGLAPADTGDPSEQQTEAHAIDPALERDLDGLAAISLDELRLRWRRIYRRQAPAHLGRGLLHRILAYKLQAQAYGDLDVGTARLLDRIVRQHEAGEKVLVPPVASERQGRLKLGTELVREHGGELHKVTVVEGGYRWREGTFKSLSEVARAITGTNWNGPRFFGLRERAKGARVRQSVGDEA
jgi:hypothetical protein